MRNLQLLMALNKKITIVLADDHNLIRKGYRSILEKTENFKILGEADNGEQLINLIHFYQPDIAIVDIEMPVMNGIEALRVIKKEKLHVKPIILSMHFSDYYVSQLILEGACAYLTKNAEVEEVLHTIQMVYRDGFYFGNSISKQVLQSISKNKKHAHLADSLVLSKREVEVLIHICAGHKNKEIAEILKISVNTVDYHRNNIFEKSGAENIVQLVKYAIKNGLTNID